MSIMTILGGKMGWCGVLSVRSINLSIPKRDSFKLIYPLASLKSPIPTF